MKTFRILANFIVAAFLAICSISASAGTLSQLPLSLKSGVPPNIMFALSVEFPTAITPAYGKNSSNSTDSSYSRSNTYLGYFDPNKCYSYNATATAGNTGYFVPGYIAGSTDGTSFSYPARSGEVQYACVNNYWSGNFLNWATMAGLDEFRYAMTGGNRVMDLPNSSTNPGGLTVLERSYQTSQGSNFITKSYTEDGFTTIYNAASTLTITSKGQGVQMSVAVGGSLADVATCSTPGGAHGCDAANAFTLQNSGSPVTCSTWTGSGTSAAPYKCTAFSSGLTSVTAGSAVSELPTATGGAASPGTLTASCSGMVSGAPNCTFTTSNGWTGTCAYWLGDGVTQPYTCSAFTFPANEFFSVTSPTIPGACGGNCLTFPGTSPFANSSVTCTVSTSGTGTALTTTCTSTDGYSTTGTCSGAAYGGSGTSGSPFSCATLAVVSPAGDSFSAISSATSAQYGSPAKYFNTKYTFTNNVPVNVNYINLYTGNYKTTGIYYVSEYSVNDAATNIYNVRVQVCSTSVGVESNCTLYGDNATWKPTGVLQGNGNTMRFGVTSYFNANDIDNAVLRAKAKYLAPQQFLSAGTFTPNAASEWSATDGTFVNNPDSGDSASWKTGLTPTNSGVINYINKFGSTSASYKTYDDIGKLYYETLKYFRGGNYTAATSGTFTPAPTADFYNGTTQANSDGFPVITTWDDPIKYSCQKNYIITMGDAHTWCDKRLPGGTYSSNGNSVCNAYTDSNSHAHVSDLGSLPGDTGITGTINGTTINSASGTNDATNAVGSMEGISVGAQNMTGAGGASYYIGGLAAWAASNNIRPDMAANTSPMHVKSFIIDVQEAGDCAYQKQFWLAAKYGDPNDYTFSSTGVATWNSAASWYNSIPGNSISCSYDSPPNYGSTTLSMNWPKNLLSAGDPVSMVNSVKSAIQSIAAEQGDEAALAQSAGTLNTGTGAYIYQAVYNSGGWTGDVRAFIINQNGVVSTTPDWSASQMLPQPSARKVFSFNRTTNAGISFAPDSSGGLSNFDSYEQGLLNTSNLGVVDSLGVDRVKYINGDMSNEAYLPSTTGATTTNTQANHGWRSRVAVGSACNYTVVPYTCPVLASYSSGPTGQLGDVIDSNPLYVAAPSASYPDATYKTFATASAQVSRTPMIYAGGNDGMLHAYNAAYTITASTGLPAHTASTGTEVFAYVPYATYPNLNKLMNPTYAHTFYVDGNPVSADVCVSSAGVCDGISGTDTWKTILVGGLNAGGQGIYALDITNPVAGFTTSNVLWEFTNLDDPDLGNTFSMPIIVKLNNKRWAVIFGNGFNSVDLAGNPGNNKAYLYILYVDPKLSSTQKWVLNTNYFKIALPSPGAVTSPCTASVGGPGPCNPSNGLAGVVGVDTDFNGTVDFVYGGDRNGNMWKIDLSSSTPSSWAPPASPPSSTNLVWGPSYSGTPLFSANDGAGHLQQITTTPKIGNHPSGGYMILFGTSSWIDTTDPNPQNGALFYTDTLYGIWDQNTGAASSPATGRGVLQRQANLGVNFLDSTTGATCTSGAVNCLANYIRSSCLPNYTTTATTQNAWGTVGALNYLCPQYVPVPQSSGVYTAGSTIPLGSPTGTPEQFGWFFDLPGNGERSHSDPPSLTGANIDFTTLTPSTNPCAGNTVGNDYIFSYLTGAAPGAGIFSIPGTTLSISGSVLWTPPGSSTAIPVVVSGQSLAGGAALNGLAFAATPPAGTLGSTTVPPTNCVSISDCIAKNNTGGAQNYIPGWGFESNLSNAATGKWNLNCGPPPGGGSPICTWRHGTASIARLSWKQLN
jgi:type IV pilus assembly protein PilY1